MPNGWYPGAIRLPGPAWKQGYNGGTRWVTHEKTSMTYHTAEYDLPDDEKVLHNALFSARQASWPFTLTKPNLYIPAMLFQHYPVDAVCWHAGFEANLWTVGVECEGIAPDKITGSQYDLLVKLTLWVGEDRGWPTDCWHRGHGLPTEPGGLYEHYDWMSTLCQVFSRGMIDSRQLIADLQEEEVDEKRIGKIEEQLAHEQRKTQRLELLLAWHAKMGTPEEAARFWELINEGGIAWRLKDNGWTPPSP